MATLINGDGNAAVYAAQDSDWFAGVEGNTTKILKVGAKMEYEIEDANTIAIKNGVLVTKEGRRVQIDAGAIDEFIIPTGTQGVIRYFIIGYHLYTDPSSNQLCETFVQLMANDTDTIPEDTFRGGSTDVYVSLYRVKQDGITLDTIQSLLPEGVDLDGIGDEIDDIKDDIDQINSDLTEKADKIPTGDITITANNGETFSRLLNRLYALIDFDKLSVRSVLMNNGGHIARLQLWSSAQCIFSNGYTSSTGTWNYGITFLVRQGGSTYFALTNSGATDYSNTDATGITLTLYY